MVVGGEPLVQDAIDRLAPLLRHGRRTVGLDEPLHPAVAQPIGEPVPAVEAVAAVGLGVVAGGEDDQARDALGVIERVLHQRLSAHQHPEALADALQAVPRSRPFESWDQLRQIEAPTVIVASRDEVDPEHPYATGERYAEAIPGARLVSEEPGASPLAWQGAQVSKVISDVADSAAAAP